MIRTKDKGKRPYVVAEFVVSFNYHGRHWTVGCNTKTSAIASFERRVAANLAKNGSPGMVIAFARGSRRPICWSDEILDPAAALERYLFD